MRPGQGRAILPCCSLLGGSEMDTTDIVGQIAEAATVIAAVAVASLLVAVATKVLVWLRGPLEL